MGEQRLKMPEGPGESGEVSEKEKDVSGQEEGLRVQLGALWGVPSWPQNKTNKQNK